MRNILLALGLFAATAVAQQNIVFSGAGGAAQNATFQFLRMFSEGGKAVTGAPYSAQAVSENTQTLGDGTRISRRTVSAVCRDGAGRTRREVTFPAIGPWSAEGNAAPPVITIVDPVARETYTLYTGSRTARKVKMPESKGQMIGGGAAAYAAAIAIGRPSARTNNTQQESLGRQTMEGIAVDGTRTTHVMPEGQIGNDRPITSTVERWFSPELQVTVMQKIVDPMVGENVYRLTNINRAEPDAALFQIPSDYQIEEGMGEPLMLRGVPAPPAR